MFYKYDKYCGRVDWCVDELALRVPPNLYQKARKTSYTNWLKTYSHQAKAESKMNDFQNPLAHTHFNMFVDECWRKPCFHTCISGARAKEP